MTIAVFHAAGLVAVLIRSGRLLYQRLLPEEEECNRTLVPDPLYLITEFAETFVDGNQNLNEDLYISVCSEVRELPWGIQNISNRIWTSERILAIWL